jgi:hypothetical protein
MDQVLRLLCGCLTDSPEMKERRARRAVMEKGAPFRKKIHTFGFSFGQSEAVTLKSKVSEESGEYVLTWFTTTADKSKSGVIKFSDVARCESKDADALSLHAANGDLLLEVQADDEQRRDTWLLAIREASSVPSKPPEDEAPKVSTISSRMKKQAYFMEKDLEVMDILSVVMLATIAVHHTLTKLPSPWNCQLTAKKAEADKRKQKYLANNKGGMKYTALAMASRE